MLSFVGLVTSPKTKICWGLNLAIVISTGISKIFHKRLVTVSLSSSWVSPWL